MRGILWQADAWDEYIGLQSSGKSLLKKVNSLIKDIQRNGYQCSYGKPERLKGDLAGYASVRLDKKKRSFSAGAIIRMSKGHRAWHDPLISH